MAINVLTVCVLCCCAPALHAAEAPADQTATSTQIQAGDPATPDNRMQSLAERLAHPAEGSAQASPSDHSAESANEPSATPGHTPLISGTPLLRPGAKGEIQPLERPDTSWWMLKTITALGVVIGLVLLVRYVYARMGGKVAGYASPVVEVLSRTTVAPRSHVLLLRVGGRVLVVSDSSAGMRTLASLEDPQEVADVLGAVSAAKPTSISKGFSQLLHRFSDDHEPEQTDEDVQTRGGVGSSVSGLIARVRSMGREGGAS
ncbi:MAG: flagellar biosynthetic protein FliO [Phycisphaerales bacterium]